MVVGDKLKVLIVEDEAQLGQAVRMRLEAEGFEVYCVQDGLGAMVQARSLRPDVLVLDFGLPGMDGVTVYDNLRKQPETQDIAILFISGRTTEEINKVLNERKIKSLVKAHFLPKPFGFDVLANAIRTLVGEA